jgi:hypothetical protein
MRAFLLSVLWLLAGPALAQEKLVGTNMDARTILNFKVSDAEVQKLLPPGWEVNSASSGPSAGANVRVTFIDQMAAQDAAGKPTPPVRNLVFGIPVRRPGSETGGLMIFAGLSPGVPGPYGTSMKATNTVERKLRHEPAARRLWKSPGSTRQTTALWLLFKFNSCAASPHATSRSCASMRNPSPSSSASIATSRASTWCGVRALVRSGCKSSPSRRRERNSRRCSTAWSN